MEFVPRLNELGQGAAVRRLGLPGFGIRVLRNDVPLKRQCLGLGGEALPEAGAVAARWANVHFVKIIYPFRHNSYQHCQGWRLSFKDRGML